METTHREERDENIEAIRGEAEEGKICVKFKLVCFAISVSCVPHSLSFCLIRGHGKQTAMFEVALYHGESVVPPISSSSSPL